MNGVAGHASLRLTTRVTCVTSPSVPRGPNTASTAPTPSGVQNGRAPLTPSSSPTATLRAQTWVSRLCVPVSVLSVGVGQGVHDVLRAEVAGAGRRGVVAVAGRRRPALEVLRQRVAVGVGEGLADDPAADDLCRRHP